ncbi:uncharacterized protein KZ484_009199 isoform 2-T2 [Pholidichthys leucotaenia]
MMKMDETSHLTSDGSSTDFSSQRVTAFVGKDVILPCRFDTSASSDVLNVEWSKEGLHEKVVLLYRDGCETHEMKDPSFQYRTSLIMKKVKDGDFSLRISNVHKSDGGKYCCMTLPSKKVVTVELSVVTVPEPEIHVAFTERGQVILWGEVSLCLTEAQITFLDDRGNEIPTENQMPSSNNASRCLTTAATLQSNVSSVTCRVYLPEFNQTWDTKVLIPSIQEHQHCQICDCIVSIVLTIFIVLASVLVILVGTLCVCRHKLCDKYVIVNGSEMDQRTTKVCSNEAENSYVEQIERKLIEPPSELQKKEETTQQLQTNPTQGRIVIQHSQPTISESPSTPDIQKPTDKLCTSRPESSNSSDHSNPKLPVSLKSNPVKSGNLGPKTAIQRENWNSTPGRPVPKKQRSDSTSAMKSLTPLLPQSLSSSSTGEMKPVHRVRSISDSYVSSSNRYSPLANLDE